MAEPEPTTADETPTPPSPSARRSARSRGQTAAVVVLVWLCFAVPLEGRSVGPVLSLLIVVAVLAGTVIAQRGPFVEERLERVLRLATVASLWAVGIVLVGVAVGKVTGIGA